MKACDLDHALGRSPQQTAARRHPVRCNTPLTQLFAVAPPERRGLHGEYDYFGLVKRVLHTFEQQVGCGKLGNIRLTQRGAIVVIETKACDLHLLSRLTAIALRTEGTEGIEINGKTVFNSANLQRPLVNT